MRQCPECGRWTLEFDDYFGRFRCLNPECGWMVPSSVERRMRRLRSGTELQKFEEQYIQELDITLSASYDEENDALVFDFGLGERTVDLPEPDGRMVWQIGIETDSVAGFCLLGAKRFGVSGVKVNIAAKKEEIERTVRTFPSFKYSGRISRVLIEQVFVRAEEEAVTIDWHSAEREIGELG